MRSAGPLRKMKTRGNVAAAGQVSASGAAASGNPPFADISLLLLRWFRVAARKMEWRDTPDPYRIWVSEIMLQQTRVETVIPYYSRFLGRFPDVRSLAEASDDEVLSLWEGLGYYARARNLRRAARIILDQFGGKLPSTAEELMELPGIGRSTAGAIAAIAFRRDDPILDANARRVVARLFAVRGNLRSASAERMLWDFSARLVRKGKGRETALAVMDLGAMICVPSSPRCPDCPVRKCCAAFREGSQEAIPPKSFLKTRPHHDIVAALFSREEKCFYARRRPLEGLLGGLWAFPSGRRLSGETLEAALARVIREKLEVDIRIQEKAGSVRHEYSHCRITLHGFLCEPAQGKLPEGEDAGWVRFGEASRVAFPKADLKLIERWTGKKAGLNPEKLLFRKDAKKGRSQRP